MSTHSQPMNISPGDSDTAQENLGETTEPGAGVGTTAHKKASKKEPFSLGETTILNQYVEDFKKFDRAGRVRLLRKDVLPALRGLNMHLSKDQWDLRKAVRFSGFDIAEFCG